MDDDRNCPACEGRGGTLEYDSDGDGVWATAVTNFLECPDCLGDDKCPGCGGAARALADIDKWTCATCGWHVDWERLTPDYDYGY
jgi:hypothetical protein